jgi:hypothetical protein
MALGIRRRKDAIQIDIKLHVPILVILHFRIHRYRCEALVIPTTLRVVPEILPRHLLSTRLRLNFLVTCKFVSIKKGVVLSITRLYG